MILITGAARSGTSMIAGLIAAHGVWVGDSVGPHPTNPRGFFENRRIKAILKDQLVAQGGDRLGVTAMPANDPWPDLRYQVLGSVEVQGGAEPWLFKDAKITLVWRSWVEAFPEARWIIVRRDRDDIVQSCIRTSFMAQHSRDPEFWRRVVGRYEALLGEMAGAVPHREVWPAKIIAGSIGEIHETIEWCGLEFDNFALRQFISPKRWHYG